MAGINPLCPNSDLSGRNFAEAISYVNNFMLFSSRFRVQHPIVIVILVFLILFSMMWFRLYGEYGYEYTFYSLDGFSLP